MVAQIDWPYIKNARLRSAVRLLSYVAFEGRPPTTKGQFINPAVQRWLNALSRIDRQQIPDRPIFLIGMGRSGTTLIGRVLGVHEQVGFLNEPKALWHTVHRGEDVSGQYADSGRFILDEHDATPEVAERARRLVTSYLQLTRSKRVVDKYQELTYRVGFLREIFPDAKIVAIVRSPAAVASSIEAWNQRNAVGREDWWGVNGAKWRQMLQELVPKYLPEAYASRVDDDSDAYERGVIEWLVSTSAVADAASAGQIDHVLRYESLLARPNVAVSQLLESLELEPSQRVSNFVRSTVAARPAKSDAGIRCKQWAGLVADLQLRLIEGPVSRP